MSSTTAQRTIEVLHDFFATHGFPRVLVSDNGPQFLADVLQDYLYSNRILHHRSAPYHPATNGLAENMVKNVKQWFRNQGGSKSMPTKLADFLCTYRNVPHTSIGCSPAELLFGRSPCTHLSMVLPNVSERVKATLQPTEEWKPARRFQEGDLVWVRDYRPNATCKWSKGVVRSVVGTLNYDVEIEGSNWRKVHVDHLTKRVSDSTVSHTPSETQSQPADSTNIPMCVASDSSSTDSLEDSSVLPVADVWLENSSSSPQIVNEPIVTEQEADTEDTGISGTPIRDQLQPAVQPASQQLTGQAEAQQPV